MSSVQGSTLPRHSKGPSQRGVALGRRTALSVARFDRPPRLFAHRLHYLTPGGPVVRNRADRLQRRWTRRLCWDFPACVGLVGSLGSPGLGIASATMTTRCWAFALGGAGVSHMANAAWCRRRRSLWSGPVFVALAVLGLTAGQGATWRSWDNLWVVAFTVWVFWFAHDRRRPDRCYRPRPVSGEVSGEVSG
jgi:peptidoglycan/LPS O-acetylase OafA/YrhL